jgi:hypothetical protein
MIWAGSPFPLQEYYAPCHDNGSLTLLFLPISRHSQNILHSSDHSASITIASEHPRASRARVSLIGNVTILSDSGTNIPDLKACYLAKHRDARWWLPGDKEGAHVVSWHISLDLPVPLYTQANHLLSFSAVSLGTI